MAVIDYTCITSVNEYSKSIRLLFKWIKVPYYGVLHYFTAQVTYVTLWIPLIFKIWSPTRPACTYLHAGTGPCTSFYSGSFAEEVTQNINYPPFFYRDIKYSLHNTHGKFVTFSAMCKLQLKRSKKTHQVEVLEQIFIYYPRVLKNFPIQLVTPLSDLSCTDFAIC